jgi:hypothetical protein
LESISNVQNIKDIAKALYSLHEIILEIDQAVKKDEKDKNAAQLEGKDEKPVEKKKDLMEYMLENSQVIRWKEKWWTLFSNFTQTPKHSEIPLEHLLQNLRLHGNDNFFITFGKLLTSPLEEEDRPPQTPQELLDRMQAQIDASFTDPALTNDHIVERIVQVLNRSFKLFFPESRKLLPTVFKEWCAKCPQCSRRYLFDWPVCGDSWNLAKIGQSDANDDGIIYVTDVLSKHLKDSRRPNIVCGHCAKVT